jgi:two-component system OmpR family response regulator
MHILLVEDEPNFGAVLRDYLNMNDYEVSWAKDGVEGWKMYRKTDYDLCILDIMMPKKDGFSLARDIRGRNPEQPIIFLTARSLRDDVLKGFQIGADDYITKPFDSEELLYRIKAILKRSQATEPPEPEPESFQLHQYHFDHNLRKLKGPEGEFRLSPKESDLLHLLCIKQNEVLSREEALLKLWGDDNYFNARSMDVFVSKLRKYFRPDPGIQIENIHSKGFRLVVA